MNLTYIGFITTRIKNVLVEDSKKHLQDAGIIHEVQGPTLDLHPEEHYLLSTTSTIRVIDRDGTTYKITIEEDIDYEKSWL